MMHPRIMGERSRLHASRAMERQAGLWNNPEVEFEVEDYGLEGDDRGLATSVASVRLGQTFELGGKRRMRRLAAHLSTALKETEFEALKLDVVMMTRHRFYDLLVAQEKAEKVQHAYGLAERLRKAASERVQSGKASPLELNKAKLELAGKNIEFRQIRQDLMAAQLEMGRLWNAPPADARQLLAEGNMDSLPGKSPALARVVKIVERSNAASENTQESGHAANIGGLAATVRDNPDWIGGGVREKIGMAEVARAKANRIPDVTVVVGVSQERDSRNESAQLSVSFPLPLFNRNRHDVMAALAEAEAVRSERTALEKELQSRLVERAVAYSHLLESARMYRETILPGAREAFEASEEAYRHGKVNFLDVLDAEKTLTEVELNYLDIWASVHKCHADIDRLTGGKILE